MHRGGGKPPITGFVLVLLSRGAALKYFDGAQQLPPCSAHV
jgi:hypothetical protein